MIALPATARAATPSLPVSPSELPSQFQSGSQCPVAISGDLTKLLTDIGNPAQLTNLINTLKSALGSGATPDQLIAALQALGLGSLPLPGAGSSTASATTTTATSSSGLPPVAEDLPVDTTTAADTTTTAPETTTTSSSSSSLPAPPDPGTDLMQLVTDFFTYCIPAPPSGLPSLPGSTAPAAFPTGQGGEAPNQPVTTPQTTQPVTYPGYAATGGGATPALRPATDQRPFPAGPLAALGGVLLGGAAAAAGIRFRARHRGR